MMIYGSDNYIDFMGLQLFHEIYGGKKLKHSRRLIPLYIFKARKYLWFVNNEFSQTISKFCIIKVLKNFKSINNLKFKTIFNIIRDMFNYELNLNFIKFA